MANRPDRNALHSCLLSQTRSKAERTQSPKSVRRRPVFRSAPAGRARTNNRSTPALCRSCRTSAYLVCRFDAALPERQPQARPEIRLIQRPIGPVAVFGASNFLLAFFNRRRRYGRRTGDRVPGRGLGPFTSSGHPVVAEAIEAAIRRIGVHPGVFDRAHLVLTKWPGRVSSPGQSQRLIVACSASMEDWMPASVDIVKSSISRLTQSL